MDYICYLYCRSQMPTCHRVWLTWRLMAISLTWGATVSSRDQMGFVHGWVMEFIALFGMQLLIQALSLTPRHYWSLVICIDGLMQGRYNSIGNALELCLPCTNPLVCNYVPNFHMGIIIHPGFQLNGGLALLLKNIPGDVVCALRFSQSDNPSASAFIDV